MRLNSSLLDQAKAQTFGTGSLWASLRKDFRMNEVNSELVRRHESKFAANSAYFDRTITRSKPYMYHIANEVRKRNMPAEIALLPFIESAFVTKAKSHVGASGLWQFMPATGRHYGLEKTPLYDGRHDVYAATDAALNYLQYLHGLFGDWSLALAAYNWAKVMSAVPSIVRARKVWSRFTKICACLTKHGITFPNSWPYAIRCQPTNFRHEYHRNQQSAVFQIPEHRQAD